MEWNLLSNTRERKASKKSSRCEEITHFGKRRLEWYVALDLEFRQIYINVTLCTTKKLISGYFLQILFHIGKTVNFVGEDDKHTDFIISVLTL